MATTTHKRIISLVLLLPGLIPWLFILVFYLQENHIRHEMKEKLEANIPLQSLTLNDHEIRWVKKNREILVNGKMFDIKTSLRENGRTTFTGLYDDQETALKQQLQEGWEKQSSQDNILIAQLLTAVQNLYFEDPGMYLLSYMPPPGYPILSGFELAWTYKDIHSPPPRC
jgi:hypothetical protein